MDWRKFDALLSIIDLLIETSESRQAEYFRGYGRGIQFHVLGILEETVQNLNRLYNASGGNSGDHCLEAFAQGYRDGCRGLKPEEFPWKDAMSA
jgi:hypothetical protein